MVHRSVVGSMERAVAHLIEVHGGAFPAWLAPVQLVILPVSEAELARPRRSGSGPPAGGCGRRCPARSMAASGPGSGPRGWSPTRP